MGLCTEAQKDTSKLPPTAQAQTHKARADACVNAERHLSNLARQYRLDLSAPQFTLLSRLPAHARSQLSSAIDELLKHSAPANELVYARSLLYLLAGDAGQVITLTGTLSKDNTARTGVVSTPSKKDFSQLSLLVRATAYFLMGESAAALGYTKKALRDDPESKPFKTLFKTLKKSSRAIEQAETAAAQNEWARALKVHGEALAEHPGRTNTILGQLDVLGVGAKTSTVTLPASESLSRLHAKHCNMHVRAAQADEKHAGAGVSACEAGLQAWRLLRHGDNGDLDMLLDKAECQLIADKAQDAINTYQSILQRDQQNARARNGMQKAQARLKQANSKDYYKMLGVSRQANKKTLKKAFHKLAKQYHPDMVSEEEKEEAQRKFQEISEAYEVLADDEKRSKFDRGEDVFGNNPQPQGHPFRHHHPFANAGFGGGGFSFRFG
jgi:tetratricopeptide (TPR) repeat protein